eukprot:TRINITY_DN2684_c0_g1_i3.p1 TRINITY_DN2684_c0_g1~~TRINITY_DN2684_c0_g1_i3.p1  ORF type:complete len:1307 (-),score=230.75 TRINITY_DN2684_c0_g1_i3:67-3987(-)
MESQDTPDGDLRGHQQHLQQKAEEEHWTSTSVGADDNGGSSDGENGHESWKLLPQSLYSTSGMDPHTVRTRAAQSGAPSPSALSPSASHQTLPSAIPTRSTRRVAWDDDYEADESDRGSINGSPPSDAAQFGGSYSTSSIPTSLNASTRKHGELYRTKSSTTVRSSEGDASSLRHSMPFPLKRGTTSVHLTAAGRRSEKHGGAMGGGGEWSGEPTSMSASFKAVHGIGPSTIATSYQDVYMPSRDEWKRARKASMQQQHPRSSGTRRPWSRLTRGTSAYNIERRRASDSSALGSESEQSGEYQYNYRSPRSSNYSSSATSRQTSGDSNIMIGGMFEGAGVGPSLRNSRNSSLSASLSSLPMATDYNNSTASKEVDVTLPLLGNYDFESQQPLTLDREDDHNYNDNDSDNEAHGEQFRLPPQQKMSTIVTDNRDDEEFAVTLEDGLYNFQRIAKAEVVEMGWSDLVLKKLRKVSRRMFGRHKFLWLYLFLLPLVAAAVGAGVDWSVRSLGDLHFRLVDMVDNFWIKWLIWGGFMWALMIVAIGVPHYVTKNAVGSGIPEMKCMLSGANLRRYLNLKTFVAKIISVTISNGSGIVIGKVGAFAHIGAILANLLCELPIFQYIRKSPSLYQQMLRVGCGLGLVVTMNSPIGGVLFSIEATSTYYPVKNYYFCFVTSVMAAVYYTWMTGSLFTLQTDIPKNSWVYSEMLFFALLGLAAGLASAAFIRLVVIINYVIKWLGNQKQTTESNAYYYLMHVLSHPWSFSAMVIMTTAIVTFPGITGFLSLRSTTGLRDLLHVGPLDYKDAAADDWASIDVFFAIAMFFLTRFIFLAFSCILPVSCGLFYPLLAIGGALGRLFGEALAKAYPEGLAWFPQDSSHARILPAGYTVVGAAAFAGGATHTLSSAVVVYEVCGDLNYALPLLIATVVAVVVNRKFTLSIYDTLTKLRKLPYMPELPARAVDLTAEDIMETDYTMLTRPITPQYAARVLVDTKHRLFPVVDNLATRIVIGYVTRRDLLNYLDEIAMQLQEKTDSDRKRQSQYVTNEAADEQQQQHQSDTVTHLIDEQNIKSHATDRLASTRTKTWDPLMPSPKKKLKGDYKQALIETFRKMDEKNLDIQAILRQAQQEEAVVLSAPSPSAAAAKLASSSGTLPLDDDPDYQREREWERDQERDRELQPLSPANGRTSSNNTDNNTDNYNNNNNNDNTDYNNTDVPPQSPDSNEGGLRGGGLLIRRPPFQIFPTTSMEDVHMLFIMLRLPEAIVVDKGRLVGIVSRDGLKRTVGNRNHFVFLRRLATRCANEMCYDDNSRQ